MTKLGWLLLAGLLYLPLRAGRPALRNWWRRTQTELDRRIRDAMTFDEHADMAMALLTPDDPSLPAEPVLHLVPATKEN